MLTNPVPGSTRQANDGGYASDSGLDISVPAGTPCVAAADGVIEYAEEGHTPWIEDTRLDVPGFQGPWSVRIRLATPIVQGGVTYPWIWYTHLSAVDASIRGKSGVGIRAGAPVGLSGIGNKVPHLHFGILHDQEQTVTMPMEHVRDLVWPPGGAVSSSPTASDGLRYIKVFGHGDRLAVVVDGEVLPAKGVKISDADGNMVPWPGGTILVGY